MNFSIFLPLKPAIRVRGGTTSRIHPPPGPFPANSVAKMKRPTPHSLASWVVQRASNVWLNMMKNNLWQRMLKNTLATTITVILAMIPAVVGVYGRAIYLAPMATVFGHPGRRFGMMAEALVLTVCGTFLGLAWSMLGLYLSSLVYDDNKPAAYTIKGIFLGVALLFHGFLRSHTPRLFLMVLLTIIVSVVSLTGTAVSVTKLLVTQILYPILTAVVLILLVNVCVFPEFSSIFLGNTTIETLDLTTNTLRDTGRYFLQSIEAVVEPNAMEEKTEKDGEPLEADIEKANSSKSTGFNSILHRFKTCFSQTANASEKKSPALTKVVKLKALTEAKNKLRTKLASCKSVQQECNFELAFGVLPPRDLKPISVTEMKKLIANTVALIGACESKYALMGDENPVDTTNDSHDGTEREGEDSMSDDESSTSEGKTSPEDEPGKEMDGKSGGKRKQRKRNSLEQDFANLELVKPIKEIESGDIILLQYLLKLIARPLGDLQEKIDRSTEVINSCLAYAYDVPKLPSGGKAPAGIRLEELDIRVDIMIQAILDFERGSASALESAAVLHNLHGCHVDLMPRVETFLISSFILNQRSAAQHILEMLKHSRQLVEKVLERNGRRRLYAPKINWRKWLLSGGEDDVQSLPSNARKGLRTAKQSAKKDKTDGATSKFEQVEKARKGRDEPSMTTRQPAKSANMDGMLESPLSNADSTERAGKKGFTTPWFRNKLADLIENVYGSEDVSYAFKLTIAVFLVTWPALLANWNKWYSLNRGLWAALQLVLITEVAIGTSVMTFAVRAVGTTVGCIWGWAAYEASRGSRPACVVLLIIGIIPSTYVQLGSKYTKAGMVSVISMCVVALATIDQSVPGSATENFLKRLLAFLIGGTVALVVEMVLFPVKARTRLVESLAAAIRQIEQMEACIACGVDTEKRIDFTSPAVQRRFKNARSKAEGSLAAAETFLPFCENEPRLKGSFAGLAIVYGELLYVLHQIVEKMDNMLQLRGEYGSSVLEELYDEVYPYRKNVAGCITLILFAVHEALTTKLPLPQFMPSARLAHLRLVNRVRSLLVTQQQETIADNSDEALAKHMVRQKFIAFQAASAGQIEVIEYLEELQDLTKLLVGANEFRSGLLTRPTYRDYVSRISRAPTHDSLENEITSTAVPDETAAKPSSLDQISKPAPTSQSPQNNEDEHRDEVRDIVPDTKATPTAGNIRRRSTFNKDGLEKMRTREDEVDELPRSLQRVRSRRVEERNAELGRIRSRREEEEAWIAGRDDLRGRK